MMIGPYEGRREALRPLFRQADDSEQEIDAYLYEGDVLAAVDGDAIVGYVQLIAAEEAGVIELKSLAVIGSRRGEGIGRALVEAAIDRCRERGAARLVVATATASAGNLRFYQLLGFRMLRIERDAFGPETGYAPGIVLDGIPLRDRVWLDQDL